MNNNFLSIFKKISINNIIKNTNNTLNVIKKVIPVYKEVRPFFNHEKSIIKKDIKKESLSLDAKPIYNDSLTFFH